MKSYLFYFIAGTIFITCNKAPNPVVNEQSSHNKKDFKYIDNRDKCKKPEKNISDSFKEIKENKDLSAIEISKKSNAFDSFNFLLKSNGNPKISKSIMANINIFHNPSDSTSYSILKICEGCTDEDCVELCNDFLIKELNRIDNRYTMRVCHEVSGYWNINLSKDSCIMKLENGDIMVCYYLRK